jgi:hypothetical protein
MTPRREKNLRAAYKRRTDDISLLGSTQIYITINIWIWGLLSLVEEITFIQHDIPGEHGESMSYVGTKVEQSTKYIDVTT